MSNIHTSILTDEAEQLFKTLCHSSELEGLTLMGGTALALQIQHRISLDFDFATFNNEIPAYQIESLISKLKSTGCTINEVVDTGKQSAFKINTGLDLRKLIRDYIVNGIKVTFFAHGKNDVQRSYYSRSEKIQNKDMSFSLMGINGLKASKILVLADRVTSRDLYDLMVLMKDYSFSIADAFSIIKKMGHLDDVEHYRSVMTGVMPLDKNDPGLLAVKVGINISQIYHYFENQFEDYDIQMAKKVFSKE